MEKDLKLKIEDLMIADNDILVLEVKQNDSYSSMVIDIWRRSYRG